MAIFICAFGLMMIFEGIPYFCFPSQVKSFAARIPEFNNSSMRIIGFCIMLFGLLVIYFGRSFSDKI